MTLAWSVSARAHRDEVVSLTHAPAEVWAFLPEAESTRKARRQVQGLLESRALDAVASTAALLVSELATNAVLHARTKFEVRISVLGATVRIEVHDRNRRSPVVRHFTTEATSGRGLLLVDELSAAWGTEPDVDGGGKTVWVELPTAGPGAAEQPFFDIDSAEEL